MYTPEKIWKNESWPLPSKETIVEFVKFCNDKGSYPKIVLATDDDSSKVERLKEIVNHLNNFDLFLLLEAVNEPFIHDKLDPSTFKNVLSNSKYLFSSGIYTDNKKFFGQYWLDHSARDSEWYRKGGHELHEAYNGGGPSFRDEPALRMPGIQDEPIRPDQCGYDSVLLYTYAASCGLMGAGATFHSANGRFSKSLDEKETVCKDAFLRGLNIFPLNASLGPYRRIVEAGNEVGGHNVSGRTYVVGNHSIRIHQEGKDHPETGWHPLDDLGICYAR